MAKKRTVPCPDCADSDGGPGEQYVNLIQKATQDLQGEISSLGGAARRVLFDQNNAAKSNNRKKYKESLFKNGCPTCGGKRTIEDTTDQTQQFEDAKKEAEALQEEIIQLEAELGGAGPGGNRHTLVVGDDMLEVGLGYNDSQSYQIIENGSLAPGGAQIEEEAVMRVSAKTNAVVGTNPLAIPGGHYTIKCGNKFTVRAGAQGIELNTEGPLIIKAGQTQLVGPEVTIGSAVGQVLIEGKSTSIGGDSISINPGLGGNGQITMNGTVHAVGNVVAQGGAHFEGDVSCISMTMPGKTDRSKHASQDIQTTGAAVWQAEASSQALKDFIRTRTIRAQDPAGLALSPREQQNIAADMKNLMKKSLPVELVPTGYCTIIGGSSSGIHPIYNFPHHHTLGDMVHAHDTKVPNIKITDGCKAVRATAAGKVSRAPVMANTSDPGSNIFSQAFQALQSIVANRVT